MDLMDYIVENYATVHPFSGINIIEEKLLQIGYLAVIDDDQKFYGILTPFDLVKSPHKIVIDCLTEKECVNIGEPMKSVFSKFRKNQCSALAVFQNDDYIGIIDKKDILEGLKLENIELCRKSFISENTKECLLNNISHEVRTPLNGILGFLEIVSELNEEYDTNEMEKVQNIIRKSADRFLIVMKDLVDLALISSGDNIEVEVGNVNVEAIFSELKQYFESISKSVYFKDISIDYTNPDHSCMIFSDGKKIKHILYHLIENAIKFSINNKVVYGYSKNDQMIEFFVKNNTSQIIEDKIFELFEKQHICNDRISEGLGIGLPLVKKLSALLDGEIHFSSDETETTFFFRIPLRMKQQSINATI